VLDAEDGMQVIIVLNDHAGTELGGGNGHCWFRSPSISQEFWLARQGRGPVDGPEENVASAALRIKHLFYTAGGFAGIVG
jgi:hypothetical protein